MTNGSVPGPALTAILVATLTLAGPGQALGDIERQRELFQQVFEDVERGNWDVVDALPADDLDRLQDYVLWPDLRAAYYRATMRKADHAKVEAFLDRHGTLKPARELRYRYALHLSAVGDLDGFLRIYQAYYQGLENARLDCIALRAELEQGREKRIVNRARELWMTGESQADECDPVFEHLRERNMLTDADYAARYALAIEAREFTRARWLARAIDPSLVAEAETWLRAQSNPSDFVGSHSASNDTPVARQQLAYAIERITYADPERALELWRGVENDYAFEAGTRNSTLRHIALWTARDNLPRAYELLTSLPPEAQDEEVLRWRARTSLRESRWSDLLVDIAAMSKEEQVAEEWRFWAGVAMAREGQQWAATAILEPLSDERSYYGFLAADELGFEYRFAHAALQADETMIAQLAARDDVIRARELFLVGLDGRGRSEWDAVIANFTPEEMLQAAIMADRWGWHSRAIAAASRVGQYDDLALRYPLPFRQTFEQHASAASIPATWALGVARSESLFMRDVRSHAGAVGLMQLMPATGRKVAREIKLPYSGLDTLVDPHDNILLGTRYLGSMAARYEGNRVLATAAYNAGPHRVDRWRPGTAAVDARIWIENIPFNETRKYVRRVMAAETIFHWRMTGQSRRLSEELAIIEPPQADRQLAAR